MMDFMCLEFLNSQRYKNHDPYQEPLMNEDWIKDFLHRWGLTYDNSLSKNQFEQLIELRTLLIDTINNLQTEKEIKESQLHKINSYLSKIALHQELVAENNVYFTQLTPLKIDWNYILYKIVASFTEIISNFDMFRIKECENSECRWVFYDESKNQNRKWCGNTCASLIKVRKFRNKEKSDK